MTHYLGHIHAYDVMDVVTISAQVVDTDADRDSADYEFHCVTSVLGTGESDHREWLRDALVALAETL